MSKLNFASFISFFLKSTLRHKDFRLLWTSTFISSTARWADVIVIGWLTLDLSESPLMVGIVAGSKMAGYILAPIMGMAADRMNRRKLLIIASLINVLVSVAMILLIFSGHLQMSLLIALALISSVTWAIDNPTRQAFIADLVPAEDISNAIAFNSVATEMTIVIGPSIGGLLIPNFGLLGAYLTITFIFGVDLIVLFFINAKKHIIFKNKESAFKSLHSGFTYVLGNQVVFLLLAIAFLLNLLVAPYRYAFLPLFARYTLHAGSQGYGVMTSMAGVGALLAGITILSFTPLKRKGRWILVGALGWAISLVFLAFSQWYFVSIGLVFLAGLSQAITWTFIATLIIEHTAPDMRGRVMGIRTAAVISLPLGNLIAGALAENLGVSVAQAIFALTALLFMALIIVAKPTFAHLD